MVFPSSVVDLLLQQLGLFKLCLPRPFIPSYNMKLKNEIVFVFLIVSLDTRALIQPQIHNSDLRTLANSSTLLACRSRRHNIHSNTHLFSV